MNAFWEIACESHLFFLIFVFLRPIQTIFTVQIKFYSTLFGIQFQNWDIIQSPENFAETEMQNYFGLNQIAIRACPPVVIDAYAKLRQPNPTKFW